MVFKKKHKADEPAAAGSESKDSTTEENKGKESRTSKLRSFIHSKRQHRQPPDHTKEDKKKEEPAGDADAKDKKADRQEVGKEKEEKKEAGTAPNGGDDKSKDRPPEDKPPGPEPETKTRTGRVSLAWVKHANDYYSNFSKWADLDSTPEGKATNIRLRKMLSDMDSNNFYNKTDPKLAMEFWKEVNTIWLEKTENPMIFDKDRWGFSLRGRKNLRKAIENAAKEQDLEKARRVSRELLAGFMDYYSVQIREYVVGEKEWRIKSTAGFAQAGIMLEREFDVIYDAIKGGDVLNPKHELLWADLYFTAYATYKNLKLGRKVNVPPSEEDVDMPPIMDPGAFETDEAESGRWDELNNRFKDFNDQKEKERKAKNTGAAA